MQPPTPEESASLPVPPQPGLYRIRTRPRDGDWTERDVSAYGARQAAAYASVSIYDSDPVEIHVTELRPPADR